MNKTYRLLLMGVLIAMTIGLMGCGSDDHSDNLPDTPITTTGTR